MAKAPTTSDRTKARQPAPGPDAADNKLPNPVAQAKMPPVAPDPANGQGGGNPGDGGTASDEARGPSSDTVAEFKAALFDQQRSQPAGPDQASRDPGPLGPPRLAIAVTCGLPGGRRRAGRRFGPEPTVIFAGELDEREAEAIQGDAALHIRPATDEEIDAAGG